MTEKLVWVDEAWSQIKRKLERTTNKMGANFPHASVEGEYVFERPNWWTAAFWPGILWQVYQETKDEKLKRVAEECEEKLDQVIDYFYTLHHDVGFMWKLTSVARYQLVGEEDSKRRALMIAHILMGRFNVNGNYIQAWNNWFEGDDKSGWSIIDTMMNLPLLFWASEETKNPRFKAVAMKHADTVLSHFIRDDGAVHHIVQFDSETGECVGFIGGQGHAPFSAWARGAAWALYGMTLCYHYTGEVRYLQAAKKVAHFFIANLPDDFVPVWDFRIPVDVTPYRDSSAGAIAASGLLLLAEKVDSIESKLYRSAGENILQSLYVNYGAWEDESEDGLILHGVSHYPDGKYVDNPLIYGDFYFVEGIARLKGCTAMTQ
ncbi:glycoside hydrolase family 88 protein [Peribacillus loiseleuriae]|uniref:glycoside hydrolase family 88 protein n=1 Tax=Peribacillus loiseleuriae TaxID=1679170 RepID=UPI0037F2F2B0